MSIRAIIDWLLFGYGFGVGIQNRATSHRKGFRIGLDTRRGKAFHWLLGLLDAIDSKPYYFKAWLADQLVRLGMRIRGDKVSVFGWWDIQKGNRAASLADDLDTAFVLKCSGEQVWDELGPFRETLSELSSLAGAAWVRNTDEEPKNRLSGGSACAESVEPSGGENSTASLSLDGELSDKEAK